jgi:hypothetical protein
MRWYEPQAQLHEPWLFSYVGRSEPVPDGSDAVARVTLAEAVGAWAPGRGRLSPSG